MNNNHEKPAIMGGNPIRDDYLVFGSPDIRQGEVDEVVAALRSCWIGTGPRTSRFESDFSRYTGCRYARALNSCTAALHLALLVAEIGRGDEVITTPMTFAATANAVIHSGAEPVFVDCLWPTGLIDPSLIESAVTKKTRAIMPVHLAGRPCDMKSILDIAQRRSLYVISDAAHAIEARTLGESVAAIGDSACFSFYVTKNVTTAEGGMLTTGRKDWADRAEILALHGQSRGAWKRYSDDGFKKYEIIEPGFKYNMTDIQAALGIHQLARVEESLKRREEIWRRYDEGLSGLPLIAPPQPEEGTRHARHLYMVMLDAERLGVSRDEFQEALHRENIGSGIHYISLHLHDYYAKRFGFRPDDFQISRRISEAALSLPLSSKLTEKDVNDVIGAMKKLCRHFTDGRGGVN